MRRIIFIQLLSFFISIGAMSLSAADTLSVLGVVNNAPYCFRDNQGVVTGFIPDMLQHIMDDIHRSYSWIESVGYNPSVVDSSYLDRGDIYIYGLSHGPRVPGYYYSKPYLSVRQVIISRKDKPYKNAASLCSSNTVVKHNSSSDFRLKLLKDEQGIAQSEWISTSTICTALKILSRKKADYLVISAHTVASYKGQIENYGLEVVDADFAPLDFVFVSKDKELIYSIDNAIDQLNKRGDYDRLYKEWLFSETISDYLFELLVMIILVVIVVILLFFLLRTYARRAKGAQQISNKAIRRNSELMKAVSLLVNMGNTRIYIYNYNSKQVLCFEDDSFIEQRTGDAFRLEHLHPDDMPQYSQLIELMSSNSIDVLTTKFRLFNQTKGKYVYLELTIVPVDENGKAHKYVLLRRDITEQQEDLMGKIESISSLQMAMELTGSLRWNYNLATKSVSIINPDSSEKTYPNNPVFDLIHPSEKEGHIEYLKKVTQESGVHKTSIRLKSKDSKSYRVYNISSRAHYDEDGKAVALYGIVNDVTEQHSDKRRVEKLQRNFRFALSAGQLSAWTYNRQLDVFTVFHGDNVIGEKPTLKTFIERCHPQDRSQMNKAIEDIFEQKTQRIEIRYRIKIEDYGYRWFSSYIVPVYNEYGWVRQVIGTRRDITDEINAQLELKKRQDHLQVIIDRLPIPIYIKDPITQKIDYENEESVKSYFSHLEVDGAIPNDGTLLPYITEENYASILEVDRNIVATRNDYVASESFELRNGEKRQTFVKKILINYNNKEQILVVRFDYSEKQKVEAAQKLLSVSLPSITAFTWNVDSRTDTITYNADASVKHIQLTGAPTIEKSAEYIHPDDRRNYIRTHRKALNGDIAEFSIVYRAPVGGNDEAYEWWEARGVSEAITEGDHSYHIVYGISINIHKQKLNELSLKEASRKSDLILTNSSSGIVYVDRKFVVQWTNIDQTLLSDLYPELRFTNQQCFMKKGTALLRDDCPIKTMNTDLKAFCRKYKHEEAGRVVDEWYSPVIGDNGYEGVVIRLDDVTERERMIHDLEQSKQKAEESEHLKMAFLANMSHEIRTPLNAIVGFSELLADAEDDEEREEYLDIIKTNNDVLLRLINDILDLSKIESGIVEVKPTRFDFAQVFDELYHTWMRRSDETGVALNYENPYESCVILLDSKIFNQVITNYLSNAFKYTPDGTITMSYKKEGEGIRVTISDTGIGIAQEKQCHIFGRFAKLDDFAQGTGLGLSICSALAETCGGEVGFTSKEGEGSSFWVWMPCEITVEMHPGNEELEEAEAIEGEEAAVEAPLLLKKSRILIAEDINSNFMLVEAILKREYQLTRAINGAEAVQWAQDEPFDAILMDMRMPVMDGLTAIRKIREFDTDIRIIALTANAFQHDRVAALEAGADAFITKPVNKKVLVEVLEGDLEGYNSVS